MRKNISVVAIFAVISIFWQLTEFNVVNTAQAQQAEQLESMLEPADVDQAPSLDDAERLQTEDELPIENEFDDNTAKRIDAKPTNIAESILAPDTRNFELIYVNRVTHPDTDNRQTLLANVTVKSLEQNEEQTRFALALSDIRNKVESTRAPVVNEEVDPVIFYWTISNDGEFLGLDLLGLPEESPLNVMEKILTSLSYSVTKSLQEKLIGQQRVEFAFRYVAPENTLYKNSDALDFEARDDLGYRVNSNKGKAKFILDESGFFTEAVAIDTIKFTLTDKPAQIETKLKFKESEKGASIAIPEEELAADFNRPEGYEEPTYEVKSLQISDTLELQKLLQTNPELNFFDVKTIGDFIGNEGYGALQQLFNSGLSDKMRSQLIAGLQASGTPESQQVLVAVTTDANLEEEDRLRAIIALGKVEEPTASSVTALQSLTNDSLQDVSNTAYLNLGLMGRNLEPEKKQEVLQFISSRLGSDDNQEWILLNSIYNAGDNVANDTIKNYFDADDTRLRSVAAKILLNDENYAQETLNHITSNDENSYEVVSVVRENLKNEYLKPTHLDQLEGAFNTAATYDKLTIERFKLYSDVAQRLGVTKERRDFVRSLMGKVQGEKFTVEAVKFMVQVKREEERLQEQAQEQQDTE